MIDIFAVKVFNLHVNRLGGKMNLSLSNESKCSDLLHAGFDKNCNLLIPVPIF